MAQVVRVLVTLNPAAAVQEYITNTWHITSLDPNTPYEAAFAFATTLGTFYNAVDALFSSELTGAVPSYKAYNLLEVKPRQPIYETTLPALVCGSSRAARELAICMSYRGQYESGVTPKRRRGRIYLGPFSSTAFDTSTGAVASATLTTIDGAAEALLDASDASSVWQWVVYSPTSDPNGTGETGFEPVIGGWVDSLPDIQRRRGLRSGSRQTFEN